MKTRIIIILCMIIFLGSGICYSQKKAKKVEISRIVNQPIDIIWDIMVNKFGDPTAYTPNLYQSNFITDSTTIGVGTQRFCTLNAKGSKYIKEEIEFLDVEKHYFRVKFIELTMPLNTDVSRAHIQLTSMSNSTTKIDVKMIYRTKPAFIGGLAKGKFRKIFEHLLVGLEHYALTGERVNAQIDNYKKIKGKYKN